MVVLETLLIILAPFSIIFSPLDFVLFQQIFSKKVVPTPPAENGRGGGGLSPPLPFWDWGRLLFSPHENGRGGGPPFRKSPELAAYSAAGLPEKVRVQKQDRKVESRPTTHFTETCFLDVLDLLITANAFLISLLCVFANEHLERRK